MKIIWITTQFPNSEKDTKGIFIFRTIKELSKFYSIDVICLYPFFPPIKNMIKNIKDWENTYNYWKQTYPKDPSPPNNIENVRVFYIKYARLPRGKLDFLEGWFAYWGVKKYLKDLIDDETIIHANWLLPEGSLAEIISKKYNVPYIVTLRGRDVQNLKVGSQNWKSANRIFINSALVTSVSKNLIKECENKNLKIEVNKKFITHNFYEVDKFFIKDRNKCKESLGIDKNIRMIFYAGTLSKRKNVKSLLEALSKLIRENILVKLYIAGSGAEEKNLREIIEEEGINEYIIFLGELSPGLVIDYYNAADLFCLPSTWEGLPNVIIEALLCGTPVIASNIVENPFIIKNGKNGFLFEPNSVNELVDKIKKALSIDWDRTALRNSVSFLEPSTVIQEYNRIYSEVLNNFEK